MTLMRGWSEEAVSPKYSHVERERRWLVDPASRPSIDSLPHVVIEDRYISGTRLRLRRMLDSEHGSQVFKLTKKYESGDPLARPIVTAYLTPEEHRQLAVLPAVPVTKRRFGIRHDGREWSLDVFELQLSGLEIVEIEAAGADELKELQPPDWVGREVSDDPEFEGGALAARAKEPS